MLALAFPSLLSSLFFFNDPPTTEIYTLSLHDALPILLASSTMRPCWSSPWMRQPSLVRASWSMPHRTPTRSEEHTSELQSLTNLVCRLLLEKKKHDY